jgi:Transglutaminase-like superfamily
MTRLFLSKHAFLARCGSYLVFLDTDADSYFTVSNDDGRQIADYITNWPLPFYRSESCSNSALPSLPDLVKQLLERRVLTSSPTEGKAASPTLVKAGDSELIDTALTASRRVRLSAISLVTYLATKTLLSMRLNRLNIVLQRLSAARERMLSTRTTDATNCPPARLGNLIREYINARSLIFSARDSCLFDSIVFAHFLIRHAVPVNLVFGVRVNPFAAHCWVQSGSRVLSDTLECVSCYEPIMSV